MSKVYCTPMDRYIEASEFGVSMASNIIIEFARKEYAHGNTDFPIAVMEREIAELLEWTKNGGEDQAREAMHEIFRLLGPYLWIAAWHFGRHLREPEKTNVIPFRARR